MSRYEPNRSAIEAVARDAREEALGEFGPDLLERCVFNAPEKTGNLKRRHELSEADPDANEARVESNAPYSLFVHDGWERYEGGRDPETGEGRGARTASYEGNPWLARSVDEMAAENFGG